MESPALQRKHRQAIGLVVVLIVYGSLFPFHFHAHEPRASDLTHLLLSAFNRVPLSDLIGNALLFLPLGALLRTGKGMVWSVLLALALQYLQFWFPDRDPNGVDALLNFGGLLLGHVGWRLAEPQVRRVQALDFPRPHLVWVSTGLMALWLLYRWFPLVPTLDWQNLKNGLKPLLEWQALHGMDVLRNLAGWLVFLRLARYSVVQRWSSVALVALCLGMVLVQPLFVGNSISLAHVTGLALALLLGGAPRKGAASMAWLVLLLVAAISLAALAPFALGPPQGFGWVPFAGSLTGDPLRGVPTLIEKSFQYGSLVFLLRYLGGSHRQVCWGVGGWLLVLELAQVWLPGRTPEITDPLLGLALAYFMQPVFGKRHPAAQELRL